MNKLSIVTYLKGSDNSAPLREKKLSLVKEKRRWNRISLNSQKSWMTAVLFGAIAFTTDSGEMTNRSTLIVDYLKFYSHVFPSWMMGFVWKHHVNLLSLLRFLLLVFSVLWNSVLKTFHTLLIFSGKEWAHLAKVQLPFHSHYVSLLKKAYLVFFPLYYDLSLWMNKQE